MQQFDAHQHVQVPHKARSRTERKSYDHQEERQPTNNKYPRHHGNSIRNTEFLKGNV